MSFQEEIKTQRDRVKWIVSGLDFEKLNEWEEARIEEWEARIDSGRLLTEKQMEKLEEIYHEKAF